MAIQLTNVHYDYAGGGDWVAWAHVRYYDVETREKTLRGTLAIGCGYVNFWTEQYLDWDDICGSDPIDPNFGYDLRDIEWQWNEDGDLEDNFGEKCWALDLPHEPYNFNSGDLDDVSEACEALWHYYKFMTLQRP